MLPSSRPLLSPPLLLLIIVGSTGALGARQTECLFPSRWEGSWFQSGVGQPILISKNELSSKGKCLHNEGDKFLLVDQKSSCYRCVVIHEKHPNVLQYKETFCYSRNSLSSLCSYITGDALLYSMFREEAPSVPCPFRGPMTFSYNRGHGTCSSPQSNVDTCTDDSRLLFRYQACPDVHASESAVEELECLATWKEGSSRYLVGRLHHNHASSNEDRYRCFVYEKAGQSTVQNNLNRAAIGMGTMDHEVGLPANAAGGPLPEGAAEVYRVAQSGDATCNGLFSPMEGSRTMTLKKVSSPGECRFPSWLSGHGSGGLTWHTLDLARSYTFHPRNASLHFTRSNASSSRYENGPLDSQYVPGQEDQDVKILCNSIKQTNAAETMTILVAHFTVGCQSGFMCMAFYRRDGHVIELQSGGAVSRPEEACSAPHLQHTMPFLTLVTSSPEPRQCPYLGKFTVTGINQIQRNIRENQRTQAQDIQGKYERVRHAQERTEERRGRRIDFDPDKRRAKNEYFIHERNGRRARSNKPFLKAHRDPGLGEASKKSIDLEELMRDHSGTWSRIRNVRNTDTTSAMASNEQNNKDPHKDFTREATSPDSISTKKTLSGSDRGSSRSRRNPKMEDFQVDMDDFAQMRQFWTPDFDDPANSPGILPVQEDYFGEYPEEEDAPKKRSSFAEEFDFGMTYDELLTMSNELDELDEGVVKKRQKRDDEDSRCSSEVTTLTIGCSTADRMEFQTDCVDDDAITAYSCHGRWFDAEGTQFVIATPLARGSSWPAENRPQPYRNARRLCFMYKESGGVVSLSASTIACQRGFPPPPPMLAFNATSIGQCMEENGVIHHRAKCLLVTLLATVLAIFR